MKTRFLPLLTLALLAAPALGQDPVPTSVTVHPPAVEIRQHRHPHSLQVLAASADGYTIDLRDQAKFASADAKVVAVDDKGWLRPVASGQTQVTVSALGQTRTVAVT